MVVRVGVIAVLELHFTERSCLVQRCYCYLNMWQAPSQGYAPITANGRTYYPSYDAYFGFRDQNQSDTRLVLSLSSLHLFTSSPHAQRSANTMTALHHHDFPLDLD